MSVSVSLHVFMFVNLNVCRMFLCLDSPCFTLCWSALLKLPLFPGILLILFRFLCRFLFTTNLAVWGDDHLIDFNVRCGHYDCAGILIVNIFKNVQKWPRWLTEAMQNLHHELRPVFCSHKKQSIAFQNWWYLCWIPTFMEFGPLHTWSLATWVVGT